MRTFSFYSYKGGSGRTTTLLNTVRFLVDELGATPEKPILLVDADLESAGMTFYFNRNNKMLFSGNLSAYRLFEESQILDDPISRDIVFGIKRPDNLVVCSKSEIANDIKDFDKNSNGVDFLYELCREVALPGKYIDVLGMVLKQANSKKDDPWNKRLREMARKMRDGEMNNEEKAAFIISYMPAITFQDVSNHFCSDKRIPANTVRFLGTNLSAESHVARRMIENKISKFIKLCDKKYNYSAVIFDCGSGTQSSADIMHGLSDVIVYCMRPTIQFILGTYNNLDNYRGRLTDNQTNESLKKVILLPNAVPAVVTEDVEYPFSKESFSKIRKIAKDYSDFVDGEFCSDETCLHEVPIFKWREMILGCKPPSSDDIESNIAIEKYTHADEPSIQEFCKVYQNLAKCLVRNSEDSV